MTLTLCVGMLIWPFGADPRGHLADSRDVEGGGKPDGLGKFRGAFAEDPVQGLAPPIIGRYAEARDRTGLIHELRGFLLQRHTVHQVNGTLFSRKTWVHERQRGNVFCADAGHEAETRDDHDPPESSANGHISWSRGDGPHREPATGNS